MNAILRGLKWYELFSRYAGDLYPGRYTKEYCIELSLMAEEVLALAKEKNSLIVAHNYLYPELQEIADMTGDSLALSLFVKESAAKRVDFGGVFFMGETAKIIAGNDKRVFVQGDPEVLGCSLVSGTDPEWIKRWRRVNPGGIVVTYINSSAEVKALSDFISTSRNTDKIVVKAARENPGRKILIAPDKFLAYVMKARAVEQGVLAELIDIYDHSFNGQNASCYVHEEIGRFGLEEALEENPEAELLIHPECGCASSCLFKASAGKIEHQSSYFLSTDQMISHAKSSPSKSFVVATEKGMVYRLRKEVPEKRFIPISSGAECKFMKANSLEGLLSSLREDRFEIIISDTERTGKVNREKGTVYVSAETAKMAKIAIKRMLQVK